MKIADGGRHDMATYGTTYTTVSKVLVTVLLVIWWWLVPTVGFGGRHDVATCGTIWEHLLWPMGHANVWHLAGNLWVLWWLKGRLHLRVAYLMAVVCSMVPGVPGVWELFSLAEPAGTVGFSGVLCAVIGMRWGEWVKGCCDTAAYVTFGKRVLPFVAVGFLVPHVNWSIHLYCLLAGLAYGRCK